MAGLMTFRWCRFKLQRLRQQKTRWNKHGVRGRVLADRLCNTLVGGGGGGGAGGGQEWLW